MELLQTIPQKCKQLSGILWKIICQQTGQPGRNWKILKHPHTSKTQTGRNGKPEQPKSSEDIESVIKNLPQIRVQDHMAPLGNSTRQLK